MSEAMRKAFEMWAIENHCAAHPYYSLLSVVFQAGAAYQASQPPCGEARSNEAGMTAEAVEKVRGALIRAIERLDPVQSRATIRFCEEALALLSAPRQEAESETAAGLERRER